VHAIDSVRSLQRPAPITGGVIAKAQPRTRIRGTFGRGGGLAKHDVVVMGASAGGVEAISRVVSDLPRDLQASVIVVLHISRGRSYLPEILTRAGPLPASHPRDGEPLQYGRVYVAPPDHHLIVESGQLRVAHSPSENGVRPAVDPLFRSAARVYGPRVIGVVLTGTLDDGTAGTAAVRENGGVTIAQDPDEAFAPGMPRSAIASGTVDHVVTVGDIGALIGALVQEHAPSRLPAVNHPHLRPMEPDLGVMPLALRGADRPGTPSVFTCPECHGTLWESDEQGLLRFRCRVGHVYSPESMIAAQTDEVDRALWVALRTLEERAAMAHRLAGRGRDRNQRWVDQAFSQRARETELEADRIRELLRSRAASGHGVPDEVGAVSGPGLSEQPLLEEPRER
jgi:two-component system, chemotaxis family, protein-glutamate methylesterase/glutaminase